VQTAERWQPDRPKPRRKRNRNHRPVDTLLGYAEHPSASVRDLQAHKDAGKFTAKPSAKVPSHDVVVVTVRS
jgi:Alpha galactosidase C-terminal beta sandwich domain